MSQGHTQLSVLLPHQQARLSERRAAGLMRQRVARSGAQDVEMLVGSQRYINFCSNDYLGLAGHPLVREAFAAAALRYGLGSGASHMVTGHCEAHQMLEEELAQFMGRDRAILFSTGYMANTGIINALADTDGLVLQDALNHASLLDGGWLSKADSLRFPHGDVKALESMLAGNTASHHIIVTDGVFSMDGDIAPLPELVAIARRYGALLMVDDAHGIGCIGPNGRGSIEAFDSPLNQCDVPVLIGTLGKAFGSAGAFVAGSDEMIEYLLQFTRSYTYSTALPPAVAEATRVSLRLLAEETWRREWLQELIRRFRARATELGLPLGESQTPIQVIVLGDVARTMQASADLAAQGLYVSGIRPLTVPAGTARLRITLCATHTDEHLERLLTALEKLVCDAP